MLRNSPSLYFNELKEAKVPACRSSRVSKVRSDLQDSIRQARCRQIYGNREWLDAIREKANNKGVPLDIAIEQDVDWMLQKEGQ